MNQVISISLFLIALLGYIGYQWDNTPNVIKQVILYNIFPIVYEVQIRSWLAELSLKYGTTIILSNIPYEELENIRNSGFTYIWMMGVWQTGQYSKNIKNVEQYRGVLPDVILNDILGSPNAIVDYVCDPSIGSDNDLLTFKKKLNAMGLKLILDFVPNHTAVDAGLIQQLYIQAPSQAKKPYNPQYYTTDGIRYGGRQDFAIKDTLQLNHFNLSTRDRMIQYLKKIATYSDGVLCSLSDYVLMDNFDKQWKDILDTWGYVKLDNEFWTGIITQISISNSNFIFIAESEEASAQKLINCGFSYVYQTTLKDQLQQDQQQVGKITQSLTRQIYYRTHYLEDHQSERSALIQNHIELAAFISYTLPGLKLFHHGQTYGYKYQQHQELIRKYNEIVDDKVLSFYDKLMILLQKDFLRDISTTCESLPLNGLLGWEYITGSSKYHVIINYTDSQIAYVVKSSNVLFEIGQVDANYIHAWSAIIYEI